MIVRTKIKKSLFKKVVSVLLAICMVIGWTIPSMPVIAFAEDSELSLNGYAYADVGAEISPMEEDVCSHIYTSDCDATCNLCHERRIAPGAHEFDYSCDSDCNKCGAIRTAINHIYDESGRCTMCGTAQPVNHVHVYDNACDATCNDCGETRVPPHISNGPCDAYCNTCLTKLTPTAEHVFATCGSLCSVCREVRSDVSHVFVDGFCTLCGAEEPVSAPGVDHDYVQKSDAYNHWNECSVCGEQKDVAAHSGDATPCTNKAECEVCGVEYCDYADHTLELFTNESEHWYACRNCDHTEERELHYGGTATCTKLAECEVCGKEYGELYDHHLSWWNDGTQHWEECDNCHYVDESTREDHHGGVPTHQEAAICEVCGAEYGTIPPHDLELLSDETGHWYECVDCGSKEEKEAHDLELLSDEEGHWNVCTKCDYVGTKAAHEEGSAATCTRKAVCDVCKTAYGPFQPHDLELLSDETGHWYECMNCGYVQAKEAHKGGVATCTRKAVCAVCHTEYGSLADHDLELLSDETNHWYACQNCDYTEGMEAHTGGEATCTEKAVCDVCHTAYGEPNGHVLGIFNDETHHWYECKNCGYVQAKEAHKGGTATCTRKAVCAVCHTEYGPLASHELELLCDETNHWYACRNCDYTEGLEAHKGGEATCTEAAVCDVCGGMIPPSDHTPSDWIVDVEPTAMHTGSRHKECTVCGVILETDIMPILAKLVVANVEAKAGSIVSVTIDIQNNPGILGAVLTLNYDPALELLNAEAGSAWNSLYLTKPFTYSNPCNFAWDGVTGADYNNGTILVLTFTLPEGAEVGTVYNIDISYDFGNIIDGDMESVNVEIENGYIEVPRQILGDVNNDGIVDVADVIMLRRYLVGGYGVEIDTLAADINEDEHITIADVVLLRRMLVG